MILTWKGRKTDLLLVLIYFSMYSMGIHFVNSLNQSLKGRVDFSEALRNPGNILLSLVIVFFFMSPVWIYYKKVPRTIRIDLPNRRLSIEKRRKTLRYDMDRIRFYQRNYPFFQILEIHATFESSRRGSFEKMACSIVVPKWGLSWNKRKLEEVGRALHKEGVEEIKTRPEVPFWEYLYN